MAAGQIDVQEPVGGLAASPGAGDCGPGRAAQAAVGQVPLDAVEDPVGASLLDRARGHGRVEVRLDRREDRGRDGLVRDALRLRRPP